MAAELREGEGLACGGVGYGDALVEGAGAGDCEEEGDHVEVGRDGERGARRGEDERAGVEAG